MYIYNVTTNVENAVHDDWLEWMKQTHIPDVLATGKFLNAKMCKVLVEEEMGGTTYSVQFAVADKQTLESYYAADAARLRGDAMKRFANQFVSFRTELEVISEHLSNGKKKEGKVIRQVEGQKTVGRKKPCKS